MGPYSKGLLTYKDIKVTAFFCLLWRHYNLALGLAFLIAWCYWKSLVFCHKQEIIYSNWKLQIYSKTNRVMAACTKRCDHYFYFLWTWSSHHKRSYRSVREFCSWCLYFQSDLPLLFQVGKKKKKRKIEEGTVWDFIEESRNCL